MLEDNKLISKVLSFGRNLMPKRLFKLLQPVYHWKLAMLGAVIYGFPSRNMKVIAVTGTKGKSTTVFMISKVFEDQGLPVAAVGSLGFKIKDKTWPNTLKMTMPGRFKLQKFLHQAKSAGVKYVVIEATSEGIAQHRLVGVKVDCAVFTNLHREHIESHGSFENYMVAKQKLFLKTLGTHVLNMDDPYFAKFANFKAHQKITYGKEYGMVLPNDLNLKLLGDFNFYNALAALSVAQAYNLDTSKAVATLNSIESIPGRMEISMSGKGFDVVVDYAHTPDSLKLVYETLKNKLALGSNPEARLISILGAAGGGRDKWKRPEFGKIAAQYCDEAILTNEDPYDEDPGLILDQIESGFIQTHNPNFKYQKIIDRREAIAKAISLARRGDIIVITGKGSENSMAINGGKKIPWSDSDIVRETLANLT